jgi:hypothetical protein
MAYAKKQLAYYREMMGIPDTPPAELVLRLRSWPSTRRESPARDCHEAALVIEELLADAERYRWLRSVDSFAEWNRAGHYAADALDAAIDAALAEQKEPT